MKCFDVQSEIPEYLEDMLAENLRIKITAHLTGCPMCRNHASRLGSISGDLRQLARAPLPFNLTAAILQGLSEKPPDLSKSFSGRKAALFLFLALCLAGVFKAGLAGKQYLIQSKKVETKKIDDAQAAAILETLKQTEASLARNSGAAGAKAANRRMVSSLEPFRWQLKFPSVSEKQIFVQKVKQMGVHTEFEADYLIAFSLQQSFFEKLVLAIDASSAVITDGPKVDLKRLPQSEAPLKVTFLMEAQSGGESPVWWQIRFLRQNGYLLKQRLQERKFKFLYESPAFLLLEVTAGQYKQLRSEMQEMLGLQIVRGQGPKPDQENASGVFPVILFLEEG